MVPVLTKERWLKWCSDRDLPVVSALFAIETCYLGITMRSRPGTLIATEDEISHHSYSFKHTMFAIFERQQVVRIEVQNIQEIVPLKLTFLQNTIHAYPSYSCTVVTNDGKRFDLLLQRDGPLFAQAINNLKIKNSLG